MNCYVGTTSGTNYTYKPSAEIFCILVFLKLTGFSYNENKIKNLEQRVLKQKKNSIVF